MFKCVDMFLPILLIFAIIKLNMFKKLKFQFNLTVVLISALIIVATGYYFYILTKESEVDIRKFTGNIVSIENKGVTLRGVYEGLDPDAPEELQLVRNFSFRVNKDTVLKKRETRFLSVDELESAGKGSNGVYKYDFEDLPRFDSLGSLDDLNTWFLSDFIGVSPGNIIVEASFFSSIYKAKTPTASSVFYNILIMPPPSAP